MQPAVTRDAGVRGRHKDVLPVAEYRNKAMVLPMCKSPQAARHVSAARFNSPSSGLGAASRYLALVPYTGTDILRIGLTPQWPYLLQRC